MVEPARHAVADLIDAARRCDPRWSSFDHLARRARDRGHEVSRANLARIRNEPVKTFSATQVQMLAAALDVSLSRVILAYLDAMGLPHSEPRSTSPESAVTGDPRLTADDKAHLLALLGSMIDTGRHRARRSRSTAHDGHDLDPVTADTRQRRCRS